MQDWLTPIQKIALGLLIAAAVGGVIYTAITNWANANRDIIVNPNYNSSSAIVKNIEELE